MSEPETPPPASGWLHRLLGAATFDLTPLRVSPDYRFLFIGQLVSALGYAITFVVLPWQVYQLTNTNVL